MKNFIILFRPILISSVIWLCFISSNAQANTIIINPSDDGSIYFATPSGVSTWAYLMSSGYIRGVVEFPTDMIPDSFSEALLSVNPYGLPLWGLTVQVFGYESSDGSLTASDYDAGTFLGNWILPGNAGYGQDIYFDITEFLRGCHSPYVGFNLRTPPGGTDVFSSLEYNYGHPSQLIIYTPPDPTIIIPATTSYLTTTGTTSAQTTTSIPPTTGTTSIQTTTSVPPTTGTTSVQTTTTVLPITPSSLSTTTVAETTTSSTTTIYPTANISIAPAPHISFLNVPSDASEERLLIIINSGTGSVKIFDISHPDSPFSIKTDSCSNVTLEENQFCTITVTFSSAAPGFFKSSFSILSNDLPNGRKNVGLIASATSLGNHTPNKPTIIAPLNGSRNMPTSVDFSWTRCEDFDGDAMTYKLYYDTDPSFTLDPHITIAASSTGTNKIHFADAGSLLGLFLMIAAIIRKKSIKNIFTLGLIIVVTGILIGSCGGDNPTSSTQSSSASVIQTVTGLASSTTYYWKVVADDGQGGVSESDTFTFQTM